MKHFGILLLTFLFLLQTMLFNVVAQSGSQIPEPIEADLTVDRTTLEQGDSFQAILTLHNTTPYTITNLTSQFQSTGIESKPSNDFPDTLAPFANCQTVYSLKGKFAGTHNTIFTISYIWNDPTTLTTQHQISTLAFNGIEIVRHTTFDWPDFLIPLIAGFAIGQLGTMFGDWRKNRKEQKITQSIILTFLIATRKSVKTKEEIALDLWKEVIAKSDLYSALSKSGNIDLPARLVEISITLIDYNDRQRTSNLTDRFLEELVDEIEQLTMLVKNQNRGIAQWLQKRRIHL